MYKLANGFHYRKQAGWILLLILMLLLAIFVSRANRSWPEWTGFGAHTEEIKNSKGEVTVVHQSRKTLWDILDLLIVPVMLAAGAYWLDQSSKARERESLEHQAQETTIQSYLDKITDLLIKPGGLNSQSPEAGRAAARSRTLTALRTLDGGRRALILRFLYESDLITGDDPIISLEEANIRHAVLNRADLHNANLFRAKLEGAQLRESNLTNANLAGADLTAADLTAVILHGANLTGANLTTAILTKTRFHASRLTDEESKALPPIRRFGSSVEAFIDIFGEITKVNRTAQDKVSRIQYEGEMKQVQLLEGQLKNARERTNAYLLQGKDISSEQVTPGGELEEELSELIEQSARRQSEKYETLEEKERVLERQLKDARVRLETFVRADVRDANLEGANLLDADLRWADLSRAKLVKANLRGANLSHASLANADLEDADLTGAILFQTTVTNDQLAKAKSTKDVWRDGEALQLPPTSANA